MNTNQPEVWMPAAGFLGAVKGEQKALNIFFSELEKDNLLFFILQILWLKSFFPARLGREFAGEYGEAARSSVPEAARLLRQIAGLQARQVAIAGQRNLPFVEGLIKFQKVSYAFLPCGQPAFFLESKKIITYASVRTAGRTPEQAVNYFLRRLRSAH